MNFNQTRMILYCLFYLKFYEAFLGWPQTSQQQEEKYSQTQEH